MIAVTRAGKQVRLVRRWVLGCIGVLAGVLAASTPAPAGPAPEVLATVNGSPITDIAFRDEMQRTIEIDPSADDPEGRRAALDRLVAQLLYAFGARADLPARAAAVTDSVSRYHLTQEIWRSVRESLHPEPAELSDEAIAAFRDERSEQWFGRHLIVETEADARAALARLEAGESFHDLAREVSIDIGTAAAGGRMWPLRHGDWYPRLMEMFFSLAPGEVGGPVSTQLGFHVATCDSVIYSLDSILETSDDDLRRFRSRYEVLGRIDDLVAARREELGIEVVESGVREVLEHLWSVGTGVDPPQRDPSWRASTEPIATLRDGLVVSVADFFGLFAALEGDDWPRPKNIVSIRSSAERLALTQSILGRYRAGDYPLSAEAEARVDAEVNRALGQVYHDAYIEVGELDSLRAEQVFRDYPDAFMIPESASIAAIGVKTLEQADAIMEWIEGGVPFDEAALRAKDEGWPVVYAPHTPFFSKGAFPESDGRIFSLEPGEWTDPVPQADGYQIYLLLRKRDPRRLRRVELAFDDLRARAREALIHEAQESHLAVLRERFPVVANDDVIARHVGTGAD